MNGDHSLAVHALVYLDHRATHLPSPGREHMYQCGARAQSNATARLSRTHRH